VIVANVVSDTDNRAGIIMQTCWLLNDEKCDVCAVGLIQEIERVVVHSIVIAPNSYWQLRCQRVPIKYIEITHHFHRRSCISIGIHKIVQVCIRLAQKATRTANMAGGSIQAIRASSLSAKWLDDASIG